MKPFIQFAGYQKVVTSLNAFQSEMDRYAVLQIRVDAYTALFNERGVDAAETFLCNGLEVFKRHFTTAHELIRVNEYNIVALVGIGDWQTKEYIERVISSGIEAFDHNAITACFAFELIENKRNSYKNPETILSNLQAKLRPEWAKEHFTQGDEGFRFSALDFSLAFERGEIKTYFQPVIDRDCLVRGVEALCRWEHPVHGLIGPDKFLDALFEHHFSFELFSLNLSQTIAFRERVNNETGIELVCSLNVDEELLNDPRFDSILKDLPTWCYDEGIELEIVESARGIQSKEVCRKLEMIKSSGLKLAVDDFGVGFGMENSYSELFDTLKLDRSFVKKIIQGNDVSLHIVRAVEAAYRSRNGSIVAEGIETRSQFDTLKSLGVDFFQGFGIAEPCSSVVCFDFISGISKQGFNFEPGLPQASKGNGRLKSNVNVVELFSQREINAK